MGFKKKRLLNQFSANNFLDASYVFMHELTCQIWPVGERGTRLFLKCDQKRDQAKSKALEISFWKFCRKSNTKYFSLDFYLSYPVSCS